VNKASLHGSNEFGSYKLGDEDATLEHPVSEAYARKLRHAYFACVSYSDAQIGKLLDELDRLGLGENTIVVVWGDHGWHLGDFHIWGKHTMFDWALRSTLIVKAPQAKGKGDCSQIVSSVDIYPTLMELCGVKTGYPLDGRSFAPLLEKPARKWNGAAYSYWNHGVTVRNDKYRITKYFNNEQPEIELYIHQTDPYEKQNVAGGETKKVKQLMPLLEKANTKIYLEKAP
jgi:arylsulfatase A-like enzyme